jgi:hypothetical protein
MAKSSKSDIAQAWAFLEQFKGRQVKAEVQSVSRSGMSRRIRFYAAYIDDRTKEPGIADITWAIARIGGYGMNDRGLRVDGCGMDMCFAVISNFNYLAASHDLASKGLDIYWNTPEGKKALGLEPDARIYDIYFFNANRL